MKKILFAASVGFVALVGTACQSSSKFSTETCKSVGPYGLSVAVEGVPSGHCGPLQEGLDTLVSTERFGGPTVSCVVYLEGFRTTFVGFSTEMCSIIRSHA